MKYLLDANLIIDHMNGVGKAGEFLEAHSTDCAISVVTVTEVLAGSTEDSVQDHELLLSQFRVIGIDLGVAKQAAALRRKFRWKLPDSYQAAMALRHGLALVTRNTKDFDPKKLDFILVPYKI